MRLPGGWMKKKENEIASPVMEGSLSIVAEVKRILSTVLRELTVRFGQPFTYRPHYFTIPYGLCFADQGIVSTLSTQLSWSH